MLEYYAKENAIRLIIAQNGTNKSTRLKYLFGKYLDILLQWVTSYQEELDGKSFAKSLKKIYPYCEQVLLIGEGGTKYLAEQRDAKAQ